MDLSKAVALLRAGDVDAEAIFKVQKGGCGKHAVSRGSVMEDGFFGTPGTQNWLVPKKINTSWFLFGWEVDKAKLLKMGLRTNSSDLL